ncbi:imidazolonepropionase [Legionella sp. W05-934-2]|uniref:imidazolonepropionase n=1 Tax=Legionella sp. W05-934-2 TaxID=1198649 RepID=UPI003463199F
MSGYRLYHANVLLPDGSQKSNQTVVIKADTIAWVGADNECPDDYQSDQYLPEDCSGHLLTPGLIDCHTHLVHAGLRSHEFRLRQQGLSYAEIAKRGGGILSTVNATREASKEQLFAESLPRLQALIDEGVTTVEIKSGYGLSLQDERKMLEVADLLAKQCGIRIVKTFLGAHAVPPEYRGQAQAYVDYLCQQVLPVLVDENLCDAVDVFCENIAFDCEQSQQLFEYARTHQLAIKCHAGQLSDMGAVELAASYNALSCDHVEHVSEQGLIAMQQHGTVAVLLPGAFYTLQETHKPPIAQFRQRQIPMAIASDANPGTSPTASLRLMMNMACQLFHLTVEEVLQGVTVHAAKALGLCEQLGCLKSGLKADIVRWHLDDSAALCYYLASPIAHQTMIAGKWQSNSR